MQPLNIFYEEPNPDRWFKYDRYPRKFIRRILRGKPRTGGQMMVALNLLKGLDRLGISYRFNDYDYAKNHPDELIGIIGKPHLVFEKKFKNPILFGASTYTHPLREPQLFEKYPNVRKVLVPGYWMLKMFQEYYSKKDVLAWPVGIDTDYWCPKIASNEKPIDFLIYDKLSFNKKNPVDILKKIKKHLEERKLTYKVIQYLNYTPQQLNILIQQCKSCIFLSMHESQGLAYQQILSANVPIIAWEKGGYWEDYEYYPKIKFIGSSSTPYWDKRCGVKFTNEEEFVLKLPSFLKSSFAPREYILNNLTLEICAEEYYNIYISNL